jgi:hypothetical protein
LQTREHADKQIQQDERVDILLKGDRVDNRPDDHEQRKLCNEPPTAHAVAHDVRCALAAGKAGLVLFVPVSRLSITYASEPRNFAETWCLTWSEDIYRPRNHQRENDESGE